MVHFLPFGYPTAPSPCVKKTIFPLLNCCCTFVKNQLSIILWVYFWALYYVPLTYVSVPLPSLHHLEYSNYIRLDTGKSDSSHFILLFQSCFSYSTSFVFHIIFKMILLMSAKYCGGISIRIILSLHINGENWQLYYVRNWICNLTVSRKGITRPSCFP